MRNIAITESEARDITSILGNTYLMLDTILNDAGMDREIHRDRAEYIRRRHSLGQIIRKIAVPA